MFISVTKDDTEIHVNELYFNVSSKKSCKTSGAQSARKWNEMRFLKRESFQVFNVNTLTGSAVIKTH